MAMAVRAQGRDSQAFASCKGQELSGNISIHGKYDD